MNPYRAYAKPTPSVGWTRIDSLLALYDGALERLDRAETALAAGDRAAAVPLISRVQLIVTTLANGVRVDVNPELGTNTLRLYEFVVRELVEPGVEGIRNARKILVNLRQGFEAIREEANRMERAGEIQPADQMQLVMATA